jgi:tripartite-type tricarboxylate transporter receptor subunit TctC
MFDFRLTAKHVAACLCFASAAQAALAAEWPERPVTLVVPFSAGGNTDNKARVTAEALSKVIGKSFVVDNKAGAGGTIAAEYVARSAKDGHTLFFGTVSQLSTAPFTNRIRYEPLKDFVPIANVGGNPFVIATRAEAPFKSLQELVEYGKTNPGKLTVGHAGVGGLTHLSAALFLSKAQVNAVMVPYKGGAAALTDVLSGQTDFYSGNLSEVLPYAKGTRLRLLGVSSAERDLNLPDVPAISEVYSGYAVVTWNGILAPASTPPAAVQLLIAAMRKIHADPAFQKRLEGIGITPIAEFGEDFRRRIVADTAKWKPVIQAAGITPE